MQNNETITVHPAFIKDANSISKSEKNVSGIT